MFIPSLDNFEYSATGTRTRVARVRTWYPNLLDYSGDAYSTQTPNYINHVHAAFLRLPAGDVSCIAKTPNGQSILSSQCSVDAPSKAGPLRIPSGQCYQVYHSRTSFSLALESSSGRIPVVTILSNSDRIFFPFSQKSSCGQLCKKSVLSEPFLLASSRVRPYQ